MENEAFIRLTTFLGLFAVFAIIETLMPRRMKGIRRKDRWTANIGIIIIDNIVVRALAAVLPIFAAATAAHHAHDIGFGALNMVNLPSWLEVFIAILVLDCAIWFQHMLTHKVPFLWRLHRVHHADLAMDVTTAIRFHPIEIALSMIYKVGIVYLLGPSAFAVILFEILLNGSALFNHANIRLPLKLDQILRRVVITPDMHRVHHSTLREEHDSNYGFFLSIWDQLFRTYIPQPKAGHDDMTIGLTWQDSRPTKLLWLLTLPFKK
ncbi:MAG: sterol desaturase family protein [Halocynthiibacter sp.]